MGKTDLPANFFAREDESDDEYFYQAARFKTHIDDQTIANLTDYYRQVLKPSDRLLDLMSSWISHLPDDVQYQQVTGLGMNEEELRANPRLDSYQVQNLNKHELLPYAEASFNAVMIVVSIQYLTNPFPVFAEIGRVLAPGGKCIVAMSHRLFPSKAIYAFQALAPEQRWQLVATYMAQSGLISNIEFIDRSPANADPLWIVQGIKQEKLIV